MACKRCGGNVAPSGIDYMNDGISIEVASKTWTHVGGDGYTYEIGRPEDAGTFCSWACLRQYATSRNPVEVPMPKRISCVAVIAFDEMGVMTHEERYTRPVGPVEYEVTQLPDGVDVLVRFKRG